jgi:N6-adenosine-specific RNA methylase IME4
MTYEAHALANLFPMMSAIEAMDLDASIAARGLEDPIILHEGRILDGRNRYASCLRLGVTPHFRNFCERGLDGPRSPLDFVIDKNLRRRHLDESQRAMVAANIAMLKHGQRANRESPIGDSSVTQADAARMLRVGKRSVERARDVLDHGAPELIAAVRDGSIAVSMASDFSQLPISEQVAILARQSPGAIEAAAKDIRARKATTRRDARLDRIVAISAGARPLPADRRWPVIYADPPWRFESGDSDRSIENHYPTMSIDEICALGVAAIATPDAVLFLWATIPHLELALRVVNAWGFAYKSHFVWTKDKIGLGYWNRQQHEILLIATRGSFPAPLPADRVSSVLAYPRGRHSAKPLEIGALIAAMYPSLPHV